MDQSMKDLIIMQKIRDYFYNCQDEAIYHFWEGVISRHISGIIASESVIENIAKIVPKEQYFPPKDHVMNLHITKGRIWYDDKPTE